MDSYKQDNLPVGAGGTLEIELPSGKVREMELVGVVNDQTTGSTGSGGFFLAPILGYTTLETAEWLGSSSLTMDHLYVTVESNPDDVEYLREVATQVSQELEDNGVVIYSSTVRASNDHPNRVYVEAISSVLIVLGFLVMGLTGWSLVTLWRTGDRSDESGLFALREETIWPGPGVSHMAHSTLVLL